MRRKYAGGHGGFKGVYSRLTAREYWNHLNDRGYVTKIGQKVRVINFGRMPSRSMTLADAEAYKKFRRQLRDAFRSSEYVPQSQIEKMITKLG